MLMRKINAGLSLLSAVLLLGHTISKTVCMISQGTIEKNSTFMPWILFGIMLAHAVISIDFVVSVYSENEESKCKAYPKLNVPTIVQRISGIVLIIFAGLHAAGAAGFMQIPKLVNAILHALFFTIAFAHTAVSTSKAFITLGIGNAKFIKAADIVIKVMCAIMLIAALTGFYLYKV